MKAAIHHAPHLSFVWFTHRAPPRRTFATFVVKGCFILRREATAAPAGTAEAPVADMMDGTGALLYPTDFTPYKPRADVLVRGTAYAPAGRAVDRLRVSIKVGQRLKSLAVFGDRLWLPEGAGAVSSAPAPFTVMPLDYAHAFGGPGYPANPLGRGYGPSELPDGRRVHLRPNVESLSAPTATRSDRPDPAGFAPLPAGWALRAGKRGTHDAAWKTARWPTVPADFDWGFWNAAPPDQQIDGWLAGDETIGFENMHPEHPIYRARLPGVRPRLILEERKGTVREVPLALDTLWADVDRGTLVLVWRGFAEFRTTRLTEIDKALVLIDPMAVPPRDPADCAEILRRTWARPPAPPPPDLGNVDAELADLARRLDAAKASGAAPPPIDMGAVPPEWRDLSDRLETLAKRPDALPDNPAALEKDIAALAATLEGLERAGAVEGDPAAARALLDQARSMLEALGEHPPDLSAPPTAPPPDADLATIGEGLQATLPKRLRPDAEALAGAARAGGGFPKADLTKANLAGLDLAGIDLAGADLRGALLCGARLTGATLAGADLRRADLTKADLSGADLSRAVLTRATLSGAVLAGARIGGADLSGLDLSGLDLGRVTGQAADLSEADLTGADLGGADLPRADLRGARLDGVRGRGAILRGADMAGVRAHGAEFAGADLSGAMATDGAMFAGARMAGVRAPLSNWDGCDLGGADLSGADLDRANFTGAQLGDATLTAASARGTVFDEAGLVRARFDTANLLRASFNRADCRGADFTGANLYGAGFGEALMHDPAAETVNERAMGTVA